MSFNFYQQYSSWSTVDLLKIIQDPSEYQQEAVETAKKILEERTVTPEDKENAAAYFRERDATQQARKHRINAYKEKTTDFLDPLLNPGTEVRPEKWLNLFVVVIGLQYAWTLYTSVKYLNAALGCRNCSMDYTIAFSILNLLWFALIFYNLLKRKRWGWILLFADNVISLVLRISEIYIFFEYQRFHRGDTGTFIWTMFIKGAVTLFLWRRTIADLFGVSAKTKNETAVVATVIGVLIAAVFRFL